MEAIQQQAPTPITVNEVPQAELASSPQHRTDLAEVQKLFDLHINNAPKAFRYKKTKVLLLTWEKTDLKVKPEVERLERLFKDKYHFEVRWRSIADGPRAQVDFHFHLSGFMREHDEEGTLLIIYYAGHGWRKSDDNFCFVRRTNEDAQEDPEHRKRNMVVWENAEPLLEASQGDILVILDCCHAGELCRFRQRRSPGPVRLQFLGACGANQLTEAAGEKSFTQALIWALDKLSSETEPFPVSKLLATIIQEAPNFPNGLRPALSDRLYASFSHIHLAPMHPDHVEPSEPTSSTEQGVEQAGYLPKDYLDLRFYFRGILDEKSVINTAQTLSRLMKEDTIQVDGIQVIDKYMPKELRWVQHWRSIAKKGHRNKRESLSNGVDYAPNGDIQDKGQHQHPNGTDIQKQDGGIIRPPRSPSRERSFKRARKS